MTDVTTVLSEEHKNILKVIEVLIEECEKIEKGKNIDEDFFKKVIDFIRNYADKFHHAKEEDILFKELCEGSSSEKMHCNPVEQMLHEHDMGRDFVKKMEGGLKSMDKSEIINGSRGYANLLKEHIFKEDNILYPMSEEAIDEKTKNEINKKFDEVEKKKKSEKEKYLNFVKNIGS